MRTPGRWALALVATLILVSAVRAADEEQWLQYRTSREVLRSGITVRPVTLEFATAPEGAVLPDRAGVDALFAKWQTPMAKSGFILMAVARSHSGLAYDRLFIDSNCDGSLKDETAVAPTASQEGYCQFGPVKIVFPGSDGPVTWHANVVCYDYGNHKQISFSAAGWYEGTIKVAGKDARCTLVDYNSNGCFDDVSADPESSDRIGIGVGNEYAVFCLGKYVSVDNALYSPKPSKDGASIVLTAATNVPMGAVKVPEGVVLVTLAGENGEFNLKPKDGTVQVPAGKWTVRSWQVDKRDKRGSKWMLMGSQAPATSAIEVTEGKETSLDVGEPVTAALAVGGSNGAYSFSEQIKGRLGERISMTENGSMPPAPKLRIKNADGSYDKVFAFQYG